MATANEASASTGAPVHQQVVHRPHLNDRTFVFDWQSYYPTGVPHNYDVVHEPGGKIPKYYNEFYIRPELYISPPSDKKALFSTDNGTLPARAVADPVEGRCMKLWSASLIQETCNSIRRKHWRDIRDLKSPVDVLDLFHFFDAHDIYQQGYLNLWNVVHHLVRENRNLANCPNMTFHYEVGLWIDTWLDKDTSKMKLVHCGDDVLMALSPAEQRELRELKDEDLTITRYSLTYRRDMLRADGWAKPRRFPETSLETYWMKGIVYLWLGKSPLPSCPPKSARLTTSKLGSLPTPVAAVSQSPTLLASPAPTALFLTTRLRRALNFLLSSSSSIT